jgi:hypothetical protein
MHHPERPWGLYQCRKGTRNDVGRRDRERRERALW